MPKTKIHDGASWVEAFSGGASSEIWDGDTDTGVSTDNGSDNDVVTITAGGTVVATMSSTGVDFKVDVSGTRILNSVYNDIVDHLPSKIIGIPGFVYAMVNGDLKIATKYCQKGLVGIVSDTYGFGLGSKDRSMPIAIGGIVLAHVESGRKHGDALTSSPSGKLKKMGWLKKILFPERIVATFYRVEKRNEWNGLRVEGREWVKVK